MSFQERHATEFLQSQRHQLDRQSQAVNTVIGKRKEIAQRKREVLQDIETVDRKKVHLLQRKEQLLVERQKRQEEEQERNRLRREIEFHEEEKRRNVLQLENLGQFKTRHGDRATSDFTSLSGIEPMRTRVTQVPSSGT